MTYIHIVFLLIGVIAPALVFAQATQVETQFSFSLGSGQLQSPVANTTATKLTWLPRWSVYANNFYMENLDLGWIALEQETWSVDLVGRANLDAAWFDTQQLRYAMFRGLQESGHIWISEDTTNNPELFDAIVNVFITPRNRQYSYLTGINIERHWPTTTCSSSLLYDITGVHDGNQLALGCEYLILDTDVKLAAKFQSRRLSNSFANYYYGFYHNDSITEFSYTPNHFWLPKLELNAAYIINPTWSISGFVASERYPLFVKDNGYLSHRINLAWFIGVRYTW